MNFMFIYLSIYFVISFLITTYVMFNKESVWDAETLPVVLDNEKLVSVILFITSPFIVTLGVLLFVIDKLSKLLKKGCDESGVK